ncbi:dephospho-CoA kinase [uncultured Croceitalea sp.]|uniref:dephospho-CoA kinase n=1 Tax=uncultured Croceitalea sp. TaxID=1798908 RepID=UPI00330582BB
MIVGLTGGIGSGKSTVAKMFQRLGVPVYDSDAAAKQLMVDSKPVREAVMELFGTEAYSGEKLNRTYIARYVFEDTEMLQKLNAIVHPAVRAHFIDWARQQDNPYVIQETALIFENNAQTLYDATILVTAPQDIRIQRVMDRDVVQKKTVLSRIANQLPDIEKVDKADYVINNIDLDVVEKKVSQIHSELLAKTNPR